MIKYLGQISVVAFFVSALFWALASGSMAVSGKTKRPLLHLILGAALQFLWFPVVSIIALVNLFSKNKTQQKQAVVAAPTPATPDIFNDPWQ